MPPSSSPESRNSNTDKTASPMARRAGLIFPVGRIHRHLKRARTTPARIGAKAAVFTAAVLEYLIAELTELAVIVANECRKKHITPHIIQIAIRSDEDFDTLINAIIPNGGVIPYIHPAILANNAAVIDGQPVAE